MNAVGRIARGYLVLAVLHYGNLAFPRPANQSLESSVVAGIDSAVQARVANVASFTDIERYDVYRGQDETNPAAEITAKVTYRKGVGKSYTILSQTGSAVIRKFGLMPLLDNEKEINRPGNVEKSWFTSANYDMKLESAAAAPVGGRACYALAIKPRRKAPNLIDGTLWVDARDFSIVRVQGIASQKPSIFAGTTHMMRDYKNIDGYPMATHARAESDSRWIGRTVVTIDYSDYHLEIRASR